MTSAELEQRLLQLYTALDSVSHADFSTVKTEYFPTRDGGGEIHWRLSGTAAERKNRADQLVASIAQLKDPLRKWCSKNGKVFEGDTLIDSERSVGIIHDLWNSTKHGGLDYPPRSGHHPKLVNIWQEARSSTPGASMTLHTGEGQDRLEFSPGWSFVVFADVIDEITGDQLGDLVDLCTDAIGHWERVLQRAGIRLPHRPSPALMGAVTLPLDIRKL